MLLRGSMGELIKRAMLCPTIYIVLRPGSPQSSMVNGHWSNILVRGPCMVQTFANTNRVALHCGPTLCHDGLVWSYIVLRGPLYSHFVLTGSSVVLDCP